ncbi:MAG TPA: hypothetical protein VHO72_11555 [Bacteroidales bacterium]|nr:hypothetical protein [Bacteroidales bacterium]
MKTIQNLAFIALFAICNIWVGYSQAQTSEVRKGSTVSYSVADGHTAGQEYRWVIVGGTPTPATTIGTGTTADPYIINYTADLPTISVTWPADDNNTTGDVGIVKVQKRVAGGCISVLQDMQVTRWSAATAAISGPNSVTICNGIGFTVPVAFTGAPNFDLDYTIVSTLTGVSSTTTGKLTAITGGTANISIPAADLVNTTNADQTYTITLNRMNDGFAGDGTIGTANTFTITVSAPAATGPITVSPASLTRR